MLSRKLLFATGLIGLAACTLQQVGQEQIETVNVATYGKLQFGVGWVTAYPTSPAMLTQPEIGLNFVATFRQPDGRSAVLSDVPTVTIPLSLAQQLPPPAAPTLSPSPSPSPTPLPGHTAKPTPVPTATPSATFTPSPSPIPTILKLPSGDSVLGAGINNGSFPAPGANFSILNGVGGPPAFPPPANATALSQQFPEGYLAMFPVAPQNGNAFGASLSMALADFPGTYTLNVAIPVQPKANPVVYASATLGGKPLPVFDPPSITPDGTGGALVTIMVPDHVTETIVTIVGVACQQAATTAGASPAPVTSINEVYSLVSHKAGPGIDHLTLPDAVTPIGGLGVYSSLCSAAQYSPTGQGFSVTAVGFDYPAFESVYPQNFSETPVIVGAAGQPDITISGSTFFLTP